MVKSEDVIRLMLWIHEVGLDGGVYPIDDDFIWKRAGLEDEFFYCKYLQIYKLDLS